MNRRRKKQIVAGLMIVGVIALVLYASGVFSKSKKNVSFSPQESEERSYIEHVHPEEYEIDEEMELL